MRPLTRVMFFLCVTLFSFVAIDASAEDQANVDVIEEATVYDDIVVTYLGEITPERFPNEFEALKKHPADMIHSPVTAAVAQTFAIFCFRDGFREDTRLNRGYRIQIGRFLSRFKKEQLELMLKRGFGLDQRVDDDFRFGIHYFKGNPPKDLGKKVSEFLELRADN